MLGPHFQIEMARLRGAELEERARRLRASRKDPQPLPVGEAVTMRVGALTDSRELEQIAVAAAGRSPIEPVLIGELAGRPVAAVSLINGAVVAECQDAAKDVVALLRLRALQLRRRQARAGSHG
jgi:hypothetical protein